MFSAVALASSTRFGSGACEGVRLASQNHGLPVTGEKVKKGYEALKNFDLQGFLPPLTVTPQDHEGGGWARVYQVKGTEWVPVGDWIRGYHSGLLSSSVKEENMILKLTLMRSCSLAVGSTECSR